MQYPVWHLSSAARRGDRSTSVIVRGSLLIGALLVAASALAAAPAPEPPRKRPDPGFLDLHHTAWTVRQGAPGPVLGLAQTPDGWLWVGTPTGLFRFDGVRFERIETLGGKKLLSSGIRELKQGPSGELWIMYIFGGLSRYRDGTLTHHGPSQGLGGGTAHVIAWDPRGRAWAATSGGVYRLDGERWTLVGPQRGISGLVIDRSGTVWARAHNGDILAVRPDDVEPRKIVAGSAGDDAQARLLFAPDGALWVAEAKSGIRRLGPEGLRPAAAQPRSKTAEIFLDSKGMAWYADDGGLYRDDPAHWNDARRAAEAGRFAAADGLSSPTILAMLEDKEGNVWLGTLRGLDRFRPNRLHRLTVNGRHDFPLPVIAAGPDSGLWISTEGVPLQRTGPAASSYPQLKAFPFALRVDPANVGWLANAEGVWRIDGDRVSQVVVPEETRRRWPRDVAWDGKGRLWVAGAGGMFRRDGSTWTHVDSPPPNPAEVPVMLHTDAQGRVWAGFLNSRLVLFDGDRRTAFDPGQGLDVGNVLSLSVKDDRAWVGGESGVALLAGGRARPLIGEGGVVFRGVAGIIETRESGLWLNGAEGIAHIVASELARFVADPLYLPRFERFDHLDGLEGAPETIRSLPAAVQTRDGKIWFCTSSNIWWLDPAAIARNTIVPSVVIRSVRAQGHEWPAGGDVVLPRHTNSLEIDYTALSLTMPERVRFRYKLEGVDRDWQDAGTRRTAYYTSPGAGDYRFHVMASNNDGVWNSTGATLVLSVEPAVHQTLWFRIAAAAAMLSLGAALYLVRVRQLTARAADRIQTRLMERQRIAGELHDTLLQGIHGLLLRMQSLLAGLSDKQARQTLEQAVSQAERLVEQGRDRIAGLHATMLLPDKLSEALRALADELSATHSTRIEVRAIGSPPALNSATREEIVLLAREAMVNALQHAQAALIEVTLEADAQTLRLSVRDDGRGMPEPVLSAGSMPGHWGLPGMRQRATRIGAVLSIRRPPEGGTEVALTLDLRQAAGVATD